MGLRNFLGKFCIMKKVRDDANAPKNNTKDSENKASEQEEMKEEQHELDLKENYEADEKYEDSKD
jgi:hypothetical protein